MSTGQLPVFCGFLPSGSASAINQFVVGKLDNLKDADPRRWLIQEMDRGSKFIQLTEPVLIHRVFTMNQHANGKQELVVVHQMIDDPYWISHRGAVASFNLSHFVTARILDPEIPRENEEIRRYEASLTSRFAQSSGIVLPLR